MPDQAKGTYIKELKKIGFNTNKLMRIMRNEALCYTYKCTPSQLAKEDVFTMECFHQIIAGRGIREDG